MHCPSELDLIGEADGREIGNVQIAGEPVAICCDAVTDSLYVAIGSPGVIQVIDVGHMAVSGTVVTEAGAKTTALDALRRVLYVFKPNTCSVAAFRVRNNGT